MSRSQLKKKDIFRVVLERSMPRVPYTFREGLRLDGAQKRKREQNRLQDSCRAVCQVGFDRINFQLRACTD
jgi:hypothetical protein